MNKNEKKDLIASYKLKARNKYKKLTSERKKRRKLPFKEQFELWKKDRQSFARWKTRIQKTEDQDSKKAQKKGFKLFKKLLRRKYVIAIWVVVVLTITILFGSWIYGATRPLTPEQQTAREQSLVVARNVMDEGIVLLRNEEDVLPLKSKDVSVFGTSAAAPVYGGGGAGGIAAKDVEGLYKAFGDAGINYDKNLYNVYNNFVANKKASTDEYTPPTGSSLLDILVPNIAGFLATSAAEMPVDQLPEGVLGEAKAHSDTAVYVVARAGMETRDFTEEQLELSADERATIELLDKNFEHVVILLNTTNVIELGFVEEFENIDAVLWIGAPGEVGAHSVASTLIGETNPSGKLTDTYAYDIASNPAVSNTGDFEYETDDATRDRFFVNYLEDIYVGYRYYETFLDDEEYRKAVQYPFGYGLSYTTFDWNVVSSQTNSTVVRAEVEVRNTGSVAGKEVVQLYYEAPFSEGGIEKSSKVLGGFAKTGLLQPGEAQTVTVEFATNTMASYDAKSAKAWVLDAGEYRINVARNVRDTVSSFGYQQNEQLVITADTSTGAEITNRFDDTAGDLTYLSRSDEAGTYPQAPTADDLKLPEGLLASDYVHEKANIAEPVTGAKNNIKLEDLKGLSYDDPKWDEFLDQFTTDELVEFSGNGGYWSIAIDRLGIPRTSMYDGPASIRNFLQAWATVAYPIPVNLSATWNTQLAEEVGRSMGAEAQSFNVDAVYAPSVNLHRSPLGGRNFEYFSEDPLVAGQFGAAWTRGLQETKTVAVMKHFAANDQETNRANYGLYTWLTEQALREIYLKPFEITVKEGGAQGAMSAFNRIGAVWAGGSKPLLNDVLRDEWGFTGFVITDAGAAGQGEHFDALQAAEAGNDMILAFIIDEPGKNTYEKQLDKYLKEDRAGTITALRNAAHNISYYVLQTSKVE